MLMHDLRSPINNISALTDILREEGVKSQVVDMIDSCGEQATEIFDDFLDYIKETPLKLQKTPVDTLIKSGVSMAEGRRGFEDIQIIQEVQPDLIRVSTGVFCSFSGVSLI